MFALTISFGPQGTMWRLLYKTEETAQRAYAVTERVPNPYLEDDFGQKLHVHGQVHGIMLEDMEQSKLANIEMALHNARTQAGAQTRAANDPILKSAQMTRGPAMLSPMGPNGGWPG